MKTQYIIVGQGFAGTALAWRLLENNKKIIIYDDNTDNSSLVAAGIINPITGLRLNHNTDYTLFKTNCDEFYHRLEKKLKAKFYQPLPIIKLLSRPEEMDAWDKKNAVFKKAGLITALANTNTKHFNKTLTGFESIGAWVNPEKYIKQSRAHFKTKNILIEDSFNYKNIDAFNAQQTKIIFCEGHQALKNPYFNHLPFLNAKGELLTIQINDASFPKKMITSDFFIMPVGESIYKVGATYVWDDLNSNPTDAAMKELTEKLNTFLKTPFTILDHKAGIRPIIKDQTAILGKHPKHKNLFIFNGLGSKGALTSPYLAHILCDYLLNKTTIIKRFNIERFY